MKKPMVKLNDGTKVPLEEFITWSARKQNNRTIPLQEFEEKKAKRVEAVSRAVNTPFGKFSTFKEAVEKTKINSRKLLLLLRNTASPDYSYVKPKATDSLKEFNLPLKNKNSKSSKESYLPLKNKNSKKTVTPKGVFDSIAVAAEAHSLTRYDFCKLLKTEPAKYYLEETVSKPSLKAVRRNDRSVRTPMGVFESMQEAVEKTGITISRFRRLIFSEEFPEYSFLNPLPKDEKRIIKKLTKVEENARQANKGNSRRRTVVTPKGEFPSVTVASKAHKLLMGQLIRLLSNPEFPEFRYLESKSKISNKKKPTTPNKTQRVRRPDEVMTPKGHFVTRLRAALAMDISSRELERLLITKPNKFYLISPQKSLK